MYQPIQTLPQGPLDIIGDIHGEFDALQKLLVRLGYDEHGNHPQQRKLVFVGDLCDRGPNSPAVLYWFRQAYKAGNAFMVLGNHELNLLVEDPKDGSGWYFPQRAAKESHLYAPWQTMPNHEKPALINWLADMPLILQRSDIRIIHAAWLPESIRQIQTGIAGRGLISAYRQWDADLKQSLQTAEWYADYERQQADSTLLDNPDQMPPIQQALAEFEYRRSRLHPVRALTSGVEVFVDTPFYAGARWRFTTRFAWWDEYTDDIPVVIGHYWRSWQPKHSGLLPEPPNSWFGAKRNVFCIDYSVGARWRDRRATPPVSPEQSGFRLAALRWPENLLMFDNGETAATVST